MMIQHGPHAPPIAAQHAPSKEEGAVERQVAPADKAALPDRLKSGIEVVSGMSLDGVTVHQSAAAPVRLEAHAYARATDIHVNPGEEVHLPHEAWHVVQQAQGRVKPTTHIKSGLSASDDNSLEREADAMGERASGRSPLTPR